MLCAILRVHMRATTSNQGTSVLEQLLMAKSGGHINKNRYSQHLYVSLLLEVLFILLLSNLLFV